MILGVLWSDSIGNSLLITSEFWSGGRRQQDISSTIQYVQRKRDGKHGTMSLGRNRPLAEECQG